MCFLKYHLRMESQAFANAPDPKKPSSGFQLMGESQSRGLLLKQTDTRGTGDELGHLKQELFVQPAFRLPPCPLSLGKALL